MAEDAEAHRQSTQGPHQAIVVVAADKGESSESAFLHAARLFDRDATMFHIVHCRPFTGEVHFVPMAGDFGVYERHLEASRQRASQSVQDKFGKLAEKAGVQHKFVELKIDSSLPKHLHCSDARDALCHYCAEVSANALVLGRRNMGPIKRMLLGSTSTYCLHHAPCTVMVGQGVHHQGDKEDQERKQTNFGEGEDQRVEGREHEEENGEHQEV